MVYGKVEICPEGTASGSDKCMEIDEVLQLGVWVTACCSNVDVPAGYECVEDDCLAKTQFSNIPQLSKENAYVRFAAGYRTWAILNGRATDNIMGHDFNMETIRSYLPLARLIFLENPDLEKISFIYNEDINIVIQRPEDETDLKDEILFPGETTPEEVSVFLHQIDDNMLKVFPNPAGKAINIYFENKVPISLITIFSEEGKMIKTISFSKSILKAKIVLEGIKEGSYLMRISDIHGRDFTRNFRKE